MIRRIVIGAAVAIVFIAGLALAGAIPASSASQAPAPAPAPVIAVPQGPIAADVMAALLKKYSVPGVSVAVIKDFRIEWAQGYGIADMETGARADVNTLFQAASISKPLSALAVLRLVQDGKLALDEDVNLKLKSWTVPENAFTKWRR